jgi:hypothetical protein
MSNVDLDMKTFLSNNVYSYLIAQQGAVFKLRDRCSINIDSC